MWLVLISVVAAAPAVRATGPPGHALARGKFLVASRQLRDPNFAETVILILSHGPGGAMGLIINRPTDVQLSKVLPDLEGLEQRQDRVFLGGPVNPRLILVLIRSHRAPAQAEPVFGDVYATGSFKVLRQFLAERIPARRLRTFAGYAGWGARQLDREVERGDWYVAPADAETIFSSPSKEIWKRLVEHSAGDWVRRDAPVSEVDGETFSLVTFRIDQLDTGAGVGVEREEEITAHVSTRRELLIAQPLLLHHDGAGGEASDHVAF
jgi:putative transcriptional regulator